MTDRLLELLRERSFRRGTFTLASGRESDFFIDCKPTVLLAEGHVLVGRALMEAIARLPTAPVAVAGVVLGGCSLASSVAIASTQISGQTLDAVFVRKATKEHGTGRLLEGAGHLAPGAPVAVLEDTVTTGGSTLRAVAELREAGFSIVGVVAVVDRLEGAADAFAAADLPFESLYRRTDFLP